MIGSALSPVLPQLLPVLKLINVSVGVAQEISRVRGAPIKIASFMPQSRMPWVPEYGPDCIALMELNPQLIPFFRLGMLLEESCRPDTSPVLYTPLAIQSLQDFD